MRPNQRLHQAWPSRNAARFKIGGISFEEGAIMKFLPWRGRMASIFLVSAVAFSVFHYFVFRMVIGSFFSEVGTELLWEVFHLAEELGNRREVSSLAVRTNPFNPAARAEIA